MGESSIEQACRNVYEWSKNRDWDYLREDMYANHMEVAVADYDFMQEEAFDRLGEAAETLHLFILEDFLATRLDNWEERNIIDDYLWRNSQREDALGQRYLEELSESIPMLYEVVDVLSGHTLTVRELLLGGEAIVVDEKSRSKGLARGDCIVARVLDLGEDLRFSGAILPFPSGMKNDLVQDFDEAARLSWAEIFEEEYTEEDRAEETEEARIVMRQMLLTTAHCGSVFSGMWLAHALKSAILAPPEI